MAQAQVGTVDVLVIHAPRGSNGASEHWRVLVLQRSIGTRCPGSWETVHGHIDPGEEPEDAAVREVREEAGLRVEKLYNVRVNPFYVHKQHIVHLAVVFAAFVPDEHPLVLGPEHQRGEWLDASDAMARFSFPAERESLRTAMELLRTGDAGPIDDVMRIF